MSSGCAAGTPDALLRSRGQPRPDLPGLRWTHLDVPQHLLIKHLQEMHGKKASWTEEHWDDLRGAHRDLHNFSRIGHGLNEGLTGSSFSEIQP